MTQGNDQEHSQDSNAAFFTGLVAGTLIGAGFGVLFAPRRGAELRQQVTESATNVAQTVSKTVDEVTEQGRAAFARVQDVASRATTLVDRMAGKANKAAETTINFADDIASAGSGRL